MITMMDDWTSHGSTVHNKTQMNLGNFSLQVLEKRGKVEGNLRFFFQDLVGELECTGNKAYTDRKGIGRPVVVEVVLSVRSGMASVLIYNGRQRSGTFPQDPGVGRLGWVAVLKSGVGFRFWLSTNSFFFCAFPSLETPILLRLSASPSSPLSGLQLGLEATAERDKQVWQDNGWG
ncbi:uncharacterized protein LY79DRAFT_570739 [Colletotrichum navitas]|uniref:Uncharacterized protein n=1 Tax=Colletotrichum navitas TaxID=681940 RepID=A0AAD8UYB5_9PEZI|nr:uncharacterized protein LY79DRAFT_570739 [Colletotrichum navitas]KAK1569971.1 hypothetical protein LY79DRAFT_570739 [Colletotrichum navitas]